MVRIYHTKYFYFHYDFSSNNNYYFYLNNFQSKKSGTSKGKKFELTEEQKQEIREAFDLFDTDGSG